MIAGNLAKLSYCTYISQSIEILKRILLIYYDYSKRTTWATIYASISQSFKTHFAVETYIYLINLAVPPSILFVVLVSFPMGSSKWIDFKMEKKFLTSIFYLLDLSYLLFWFSERTKLTSNALSRVKPKYKIQKQ